MSKEPPLKGWHQTNGASFVEEGGWILPSHFAAPLEEYRTVRSQVGIMDFCNRGLLRFTGPDRLSYLQGMVSNDVKKIVPGEGIHAAVLDIHGKILADAMILCLDDSLLLHLWEPLKEKILTHLNRYLIADDVEITDLTGEYGMLSLQGPKAELLLRGLFPNAGMPAPELAHCASKLGDAEVRIIRASHTGEEGYDLLIATKDLHSLVSHIEEGGKKFSLRWVGTRAQEILRIEAGIPRYGVDMNEDNLLLETGLDQAVSFHKGCYLGQEVVERLRSRGHVNKRLVGLLLEGDTAAKPGNIIRAGEKEIGRVTSSILSPARKCPLALGYVQRDYLQPGTPVTIQWDVKSIPAVVSPLPFYRPDSP